MIGCLQKDLASIAFAEYFSVTENLVSILMIWKLMIFYSETGSYRPIQGTWGRGGDVLPAFSFPFNLSVEDSLEPVCSLSVVA